MILNGQMKVSVGGGRLLMAGYWAPDRHLERKLSSYSDKYHKTL